MQFYLLFIALLGVAQRLARNRTRPGAFALLAVFAPVGLASLFLFNGDEAHEDWFTNFFCMFLFGAVTWWALEGRVPRAVFWGAAAALAARLALGWTLEIGVALLTGLSIYLAGRAGRLGDWLDYRPLQYLGRTSYSLYLVHFPVNHLVAQLGHRLTGNHPAMALVWMALSLALSLAAAHLLYVCVEAPSVRLATRLKKPSAPAGPAPRDVPDPQPRPVPQVA